MRKRNLFKSLAIMCGLFCVAFTFDNNGAYWLWNDHKPAAVILAIAFIIFSLLWIKTSKQLKEEK